MITTLRTIDERSFEVTSDGGAQALDDLYIAVLLASQTATFAASLASDLGPPVYGLVTLAEGAAAPDTAAFRAAVEADLVSRGHTIAPFTHELALAVGSSSAFSALLRESSSLRVTFAGASAFTAAVQVEVDALSAGEHKAIRDLVHFVETGGPADGFASGAYREILPAASPFPASIVWWTSAAKTAKIVQLAIVRNANKTPATETWTLFAADGVTPLVALVDTIGYSGVFETHRTRSWT